MENRRFTDSHSPFPDASIAELSEICCKKIQECERELNKQGYWNISLVAYQMKEKE